MSRSTASKDPVEREDVKLTVVKLDIDSKLPEDKAVNLKNTVIKFGMQLQGLEDEYDEIVHAAQKTFTPKLAKKAKTLRLKYVKLRGSNGSDGMRKQMKADALLEGKVIDHVFGKIRDAAVVREDPLKEIEEYAEREQERIEKELQMDRYRELEPYIVEEEELNYKLGLMTDERWEEYFLEVRATFKEHEENEAKEKLRDERLQETAKLALFIPDYDAINWEDLKEKRYKEVVENAKNKHEEQQQELLALQKKEAEEKELKERFLKRVGLVTGAALGERGLMYDGKQIATIKMLEQSEDEVFAKFLFKHLEKYTADQELKKQQDLLEREALRKQEAEKARLKEEQLRIEADRKRVAEEARAEEERLMRQKAEYEAQKEAPDKDKIDAYAKALQSVEIPECSTERGRKLVGAVSEAVGNGIVWMLNNNN